ncbi:T9SS C-terminal target domain-containing protein [Allomuricauda sp. d1]|uniref:T9SS C-terminal target domain-containing protein n=1 Tax=Allomuricauda sp. d1 TaxID=3136725 RepID=UPI0031DC1721
MKASAVILMVFFAITGWSQSNITAIGELPSGIHETSGLIFYNGRLITHNDSGNLPQLYEIDTTSLQIVRTVTIENVSNTDWEDITQDNNFIYIADIGNNLGDRQDLKILKIPKAVYDQSDTVSAETIDFFYEDQNDFTASANSDFDAEALFVLGDDLVVLTKQWQRQGTTAYRLPKLQGAFLAQRLGDYQIDGLVTGATYDEIINELYLVGYSQFLTPFFVRVENVDADSIFSTNTTKTDLNVGFAQIEAITKVGETLYATSEAFNSTSPPITSTSRLFRFSLNEEDEPGDGEEPAEPEIAGDLVLYRTFGSDILSYELNVRAPIFGMGIFDSVGRLVQFTPLEDIPEREVNLSTFEPSIYHLAFFHGNGIISRPFIRD